MSSIPCDIVLLPDDILTAKALAASRSLSSLGSLFTLEIGKFYPHMSLYMFQMNTDDILKIEEVLRRIAVGFRAVDAKATKYSFGEGYTAGYVDPEYEITDELRALQSGVIEAINPLRAGMREKDIARMKDATGLKLENLQKYGYQAIGDLFRPHITLTRLEGHTKEAINLLPDIAEFSGKFVKLGLFEMGDNGTCVRMIRTFDLAG